jgi:hypothetical protein
MVAMIVPFLTFLLDHADLLNAIWEAVQGGATKEDILKAIRASQLAAADAAVEADLGPRP